MWEHNTFASTHLVVQSIATKMYLFLMYFPISFIGPIKFNPHFVNGSDGSVITSFVIVKKVRFHVL